MASTNNETFRVALMASEDVQSYLVSIKYQKDGEYAPIHDGALVTLGELAKNDPYNYNIGAGETEYKDDNVYLATAPETANDKVVIVDLSTVSQGPILGNEYKIGIKLYGLSAEAGMPARARRMKEGDKFWLSNDCFTGDTEPSVGAYAVATAGDTHHSVLADLTGTEKYSAKIEDERDFVVGNKVIGKLYLCCVQ